MSECNIQGFPFVVLSEKGHYELFDKNGDQIDMPMSTIRITQTAGDIDKIVIIAPINVVTKEQMQKLITEWKPK